MGLDLPTQIHFPFFLPHRSMVFVRHHAMIFPGSHMPLEGLSHPQLQGSPDLSGGNPTLWLVQNGHVTQLWSMKQEQKVTWGGFWEELPSSKSLSHFWLLPGLDVMPVTSSTMCDQPMGEANTEESREER